MTGAVTALGTQMFGRFGAGATADKAGLNQAKKDAWPCQGVGASIAQIAWSARA